MAVDPIIVQPSRERLLEQALSRLTAPVPSTKGMDPKTRAMRLHAELERRIALAKGALRPLAQHLADNWGTLAGLPPDIAREVGDL